ncbi:MAG TPA: hypothetical protein VFI31_20215 [Pirellulales bacterium]|nr:hypothetical protein [Pirellulales bacterium]
MQNAKRKIQNGTMAAAARRRIRLRHFSFCILHPGGKANDKLRSVVPVVYGKESIAGHNKV